MAQCGDTETIERGDFEYVNLHWYLIAQLNGPVIEAALKKTWVSLSSANDKEGDSTTPREIEALCQPLSPWPTIFLLGQSQVHDYCGAARPTTSTRSSFEYYDQAENHRSS